MQQTAIDVGKIGLLKDIKDVMEMSSQSDRSIRRDGEVQYREGTVAWTKAGRRVTGTRMRDLLTTVARTLLNTSRRRYVSTEPDPDLCQHRHLPYIPKPDG